MCNMYCVNILLPPPPQVNNAHTSGRPHDVKENMIHQTRPPSSIAPWSSSDAHVPIVGLKVDTGVLFNMPSMYTKYIL